MTRLSRGVTQGKSKCIRLRLLAGEAGVPDGPLLPEGVVLHEQVYEVSHVPQEYLEGDAGGRLALQVSEQIAQGRLQWLDHPEGEEGPGYVGHFLGREGIFVLGLAWVPSAEAARKELPQLADFLVEARSLPLLLGLGLAPLEAGPNEALRGEAAAALAEG